MAVTSMSAKFWTIWKLINGIFFKQGKRFAISLIKKGVIEQGPQGGKIKGLLSRHYNTHVLRTRHCPKRHLLFDLTD